MQKTYGVEYEDRKKWRTVMGLAYVGKKAVPPVPPVPLLSLQNTIKKKGVETMVQDGTHGTPQKNRVECYSDVTDLVTFCADWEYVYQQSINSTNCIGVAMEFAKKRKIENVDSVVNAVRKLRGIEC
jgi:hypothetical protein